MIQMIRVYRDYPTCKRVLILLVSLFYFRTSAQNTHVILISIDGLRPQMYEDSSWPSPNLQTLMRKGTYADHMLSVFPAYTYPSHTAMLTGALPARSGIAYNQPKGSRGEWNWEAKYIKAPTLWQLFHKEGLTSAAIMWPGSVDAPITWNLSEIWAVGHPDDRISETRRRGTPGLVDEIEQYATGKLDSTNMNDNYFSLDENAGRMAAYIFQTFRPSFMAVHFATVDGYEHEQGLDGDSVRLAIEADDRAIGDILEAVNKSTVKDSTTIIIVGDHGFANFHEVFRPNILIKNLPVRFIAAGGSAFLYPTSGSNLKDTNKIITEVKARLDALPKEKRAQFRTMNRGELDTLGADSNAIMALSAQPGIVFSGSLGGTSMTNYGPGTSIQHSTLEGVFIAANGGHHGYDPRISQMFTGFIAVGRKIMRHSMIKEIAVTDIAPLVANLLGVDFIAPDGKIPSGILVD